MWCLKHKFIEYRKNDVYSYDNLVDMAKNLHSGKRVGYSSYFIRKEGEDNELYSKINNVIDIPFFKKKY